MCSASFGERHFEYRHKDVLKNRLEFLQKPSAVSHSCAINATFEMPSLALSSTERATDREHGLAPTFTCDETNMAAIKLRHKRVPP